VSSASLKNKKMTGTLITFRRIHDIHDYRVWPERLASRCGSWFPESRRNLLTDERVRDPVKKETFLYKHK
jgi:hypothetical protein